jgi:hypothetical protein
LWSCTWKSHHSVSSTHRTQFYMFCHIFMHLALATSSFSTCSYPVKVIKLFLIHAVFFGTQIMLRWLVTEPDGFTSRAGCTRNTGCKSVSHLKIPILSSLPLSVSKQHNEPIGFRDKACRGLLTSPLIVMLIGRE